MEDSQLYAQIIPPLLYWYAACARDLPWRREISPYRTWISEIMLQQTRVEAVIPYFERFMRELPTVEDLAKVSPDRLNKLWEGLGYYSRARNLQKAAVCIVQQYRGRMPADYDALLKLPGIGPYTAGAIASIAFGLPEPAIDGNVIRVCTRLSANDTRADLPVLKQQLYRDLKAVYPPHQSSAFTQALMELGATVCIPNGSPRCDACPAAFACRAHEMGRETDYPVKPSKKSRRICLRTVFILHCNGRYAIRRRPEKGLLAGLWEFPSVDGKWDILSAQRYFTASPCAPVSLSCGLDACHIFTHIEWHMSSFRVECAHTDPALIWVTPDELAAHYPLPSAFRVFSGDIGVRI